MVGASRTRAGLWEDERNPERNAKRNPKRHLTRTGIPYLALKMPNGLRNLAGGFQDFLKLRVP